MCQDLIGPDVAPYTRRRSHPSMILKLKSSEDWNIDLLRFDFELNLADRRVWIYLPCEIFWVESKDLLSGLEVLENSVNKCENCKMKCCIERGGYALKLLIKMLDTIICSFHTLTLYDKSWRLRRLWFGRWGAFPLRRSSHRTVRNVGFISMRANDFSRPRCSVD